MRTGRRNLLKAVFGVTGLTTTAAAQSVPAKKIHRRGPKPETTPLFSGAVSYGNLLFIAGKGAHFEGDIKAHTKHVLDEIQKELENAGSSMEKVLKCNVYLNDLKDYQDERGFPRAFRRRPAGPDHHRSRRRDTWKLPGRNRRDRLRLIPA